MKRTRIGGPQKAVGSMSQFISPACRGGGGKTMAGEGLDKITSVRVASFHVVRRSQPAFLSVRGATP